MHKLRGSVNVNASGHNERGTSFSQRASTFRYSVSNRLSCESRLGSTVTSEASAPSHAGSERGVVSATAGGDQGVFLRTITADTVSGRFSVRPSAAQPEPPIELSISHAPTSPPPKSTPPS